MAAGESRTPPALIRWQLSCGGGSRDLHIRAQADRARLSKVPSHLDDTLESGNFGSVPVNGEGIRVFYPVYVPTADDLEDYEIELIHYLRKIGDQARARKVAALLTEQARIVANAIVETDVKAKVERTKAIRARIREDRRTKVKK